MLKQAPATGNAAVKRASPMHKINRMGYFFIAPFVLFFLAFNLYPIVYSLGLSFFSWNGIGQKLFVGVQNYVRLFTTDPYFFKSIGNTLIVLVAYLPITLSLGLLLANLLTNKRIRKANWFQTAQFLPYIISSVCVGMLFMLMFDWSTGIVNHLLMKLGLIDDGLNWLGDPTLARTVLIILMIWRQLGYVVTLFLSGLAGISIELLEAAEVDGANFWQKLTRITIPLLKPIILFVLVTSTIDGFQIFDAPKTLFNTGVTAGALGGPGRSCLTAVWYLYDTAFGQSTGVADMGYGSAIAYGLFLVIMVFSVINYQLVRKGDEG